VSISPACGPRRLCPPPLRVTARCGPRRGPSRGFGSRRSGHHVVAHTRPTLVRLPSPAEVCVARRVSPHWLRAFPPHRSSGLGVFLVVLDSRNQGPARSSLGVRFLFRALLRRIRPSPSPVRLAHAGRIVQGQRVRLSWGSCSVQDATTPGAPSRRSRPRGRSGGRGSPNPRRCRPQGSCPSRRFWLCTRHVTSPCGARRYRGTPTLRGLITCRSRPFGAALQSFPFPRSRTRSRGSLLPCESASDRRQRGRTGSFAIAFAAAPALCLDPPGGEPRRMSRERRVPAVAR